MGWVKICLLELFGSTHTAKIDEYKRLMRLRRLRSVIMDLSFSFGSIESNKSQLNRPFKLDREPNSGSQ